MRSRRLFAVTVAGLWLVTGSSSPRNCEALTLNQPGYTASVLATLPSPTVYPDIELDLAGNLFLPHGVDGVQKVTPAGAVSVWSTAQVGDLTLLPSGAGYGSGGALCHCIQAIQAGGGFSTLHQDSMEWSNVALTTADTLYAVAHSPTTAFTGLYRIDRTTGEPTLIVPGGPGSGGAGYYQSLAGGSDGRLYAVGSLSPLFDTLELYRLDGSQFSAVAAITAGRPTPGPPDSFFVVRPYKPSGTNAGPGELRLLDAVSGASTLFATGNTAGEFESVGYNPTTGTIYVTDVGKIWALTKNPTPARTESWGAVKALYHR